LSERGNIRGRICLGGYVQVEKVRIPMDSPAAVDRTSLLLVGWLSVRRNYARHNVVRSFIFGSNLKQQLSNDASSAVSALLFGDDVVICCCCFGRRSVCCSFFICQFEWKLRLK